MNKIKYLLLVIIILSCNSTYKDNEIKIFILETRVGKIEGNKITVKLPIGTDLVNLVPIIVISDRASINPPIETARDFTNPVNYEVSSEKGEIRIYEVSVILDTHYTVSYFDNNSNEGLVPIDNKQYLEGDTVTVLGNPNNLVKYGYNFIAWCNTINCDDIIYEENSTFKIEDKNINLFAKYEEFYCGDNLIDYRGEKQVYPTVQIGTQCWMAKNLNVGVISYVSHSDNNIIEKNCYNNEPNNCVIYGALYNWDEAMNYSIEEVTKGICINEWHIPTEAQYQTLITYLGGDEVAGGKLKITGEEFWTNNIGATNSSGFSALGAGIKSTFYTGLKVDARFWGSIQSGTNAIHLRLRNQNTLITLPYTTKNTYLSVRCIKND